MMWACLAASVVLTPYNLLAGKLFGTFFSGLTIGVTGATLLAWRMLAVSRRPPDVVAIADTSVVVVMRNGGAHHMSALVDGRVIASSGEWRTKSAAFDAGARAIVEAGASHERR